MTEQGLIQVREELNWKSIEHHIRSNIPNLANEAMSVRQFSAGYSNLTYLLKIGDWEAVFRRSPLGPIPPKAHDMEREFKILQSVNPVFPLAPKPYLFCNDAAIMERPFYIMERKTGVVLDDSIPTEYEKTEETYQQISKSIIQTLVQLHEINYTKTKLTELARPDGYLERQVLGWIKRYHAAMTDEITIVQEIEQWLIANIPKYTRPTIVHNDFKLNNLMLASDNPGITVGVFDWEMSTVGDPLTDLGSAIAYWVEAGEPATGLTSITTLPGFLKRRDLVELYAEKSGRDVSNIDYYLTFAFYKVAVILQQIYYRWKQGQTSDNRFEKLGMGVNNLMELSIRAKYKELL
ncbi:phosphotransferase family protein [Fodinisporobacter ferrooxydans]|uniref:Phosphotransferase family protein n=1 Tax=Fodinisporobacter ferrooxydans TaxID=2901836 RepID=A0ABY4CQX5_9BACL|nr:phosphotransferase family protein [Alicyclobacillaceae bacterium MYW30-H2]